MKIVEMQPGDSTRYLVGVEIMESSETGLKGFDKEQRIICFIFGTPTNYNVGFFNYEPNQEVSWYEYQEVMPNTYSSYTVAAGYIVLLHLLGCDLTTIEDNGEIMYRWDKITDRQNWKGQLKKLTEYIEMKRTYLRIMNLFGTLPNQSSEYQMEFVSKLKDIDNEDFEASIDIILSAIDERRRSGKNENFIQQIGSTQTT